MRNTYRILLAPIALAIGSFTPLANSAAHASSAHASGNPAAQILPPGVRPAYLDQRVGVSLEEIVVRFAPASGVRASDGGLVSQTGADLSELARVLEEVNDLVIEARFPQGAAALDALRQRAEARVRRPLPDLNLFVTLRLPTAPTAEIARARADALLDRLNAMQGLVEEAWATPHAEPAGQTMRSGSTARGATPDYTGQQGYLYTSPIGVDAVSAWPHAGGQGQGVDMIDIEWGWNFDHEDLKAPFHATGAYGLDDHGTAVLGEIAGQHNGYGVNGISPEVRIGGISLNTYSIPGAIAEAATVLGEGGVFLMEVQCSGPENWMPCEWWSDVYAAIEVATAAGVICVEAGGNGTVNLDDPLYGGLFDRRLRDSNAIMIGAGTPNGLDAEWFSNYGSRVDLQGWGSSITTTGYGDLQGGPQNEWYTGGFNGTSGASPIVVGSICSLQGQARALFSDPLTPDLAEEILGSTGSAWAGGRQIGERPNLAAARTRLLLGYGDVTILVRDGDTHDPMPDVILEIVETGRLGRTGPDGTTAMQLSATALTLRAEGNFYYPGADLPYTVLAGVSQSVTIDLYRAPFGSIEGRVRNSIGTGLPGATLTLLDTPIAPSTSDAGGNYALADVPENTNYQALAYGLPAYGIDAAIVDVQGNVVTDWNPVLVDAATFESDNGGYAATNDWEWGTPSYPISNPPPTFSGAKVWATNIDGPYSDLKTSTLTSPVLDMSGATEIVLSFHHWYWVDPDDGGQVQVWDEAQNRWVVVEPIGGYPDPSIVVLLNTGGYNGYTVDGYIPAVFDLSAWAGGDLQFRFYFRSTISGHKLGWYIDDVAIDTGETTVAVEDFVSGGAPDAPGLSILSTGPNPSNAAFAFHYTLRGPAGVVFDIVDTRGQRLHHAALGVLDAGSHVLRWDGRNEAGSFAPAGVYYYRLRAGREEKTGRLVRTR